MLVKFKITSIWLNERKGRADISEMKWIIAKQNSTTLQCLQAWYDHHKRLSIKKIHNVCVYRHKQFLTEKVVLCFVNILMFNFGRKCHYDSFQGNNLHSGTKVYPFKYHNKTLRTFSLFLTRYHTRVKILNGCIPF